MHTTIQLRRGSFLKGCLIAAAIVLILLIAGALVVRAKWRSWTGSMAKTQLATLINSSQLPDDQKTRLNTRIDGFFTDWADDKITMEQFGKTMENFAEGPLMPLIIMWSAEKQYLSKSKFTDAEKSAAERSLQRFARGVIERTIDKVEIKRVLAYVEISNGNSHQLKQNLTEDELRKYIDAAKEQADKANIPDEPYTPDIAGELDKAIENGLKGVVPEKK